MCVISPLQDEPDDQMHTYTHVYINEMNGQRRLEQINVEVDKNRQPPATDGGRFYCGKCV